MNQKFVMVFQTVQTKRMNWIVHASKIALNAGNDEKFGIKKNKHKQIIVDINLKYIFY